VPRKSRWLSPAILAARGRHAQEWWLSATPEQRAEAKRKSWEGFARKNPERAELIVATWDAITAGQLVPQPCDSCGGQSKPVFDWVRMTLVGWRCMPCRRAAT
jgi:hypothetical protein